MKGLLVILTIAAIQYVSVSRAANTCRCGNFLKNSYTNMPILNSVTYHAIVGDVKDCGAEEQQKCNNQCAQVFGDAVGNLDCKRADGRTIYEMSCRLYNKDITGGKLGIFSTTCNSGVWTFAKSITENFCCRNSKPCSG